jgi:hypothetical protein
MSAGHAGIFLREGEAFFMEIGRCKAEKTAAVGKNGAERPGRV